MARTIGLRLMTPHPANPFTTSSRAVASLIFGMGICHIFVHSGLAEIQLCEFSCSEASFTEMAPCGLTILFYLQKSDTLHPQSPRTTSRSCWRTRQMGVCARPLLGCSYPEVVKPPVFFSCQGAVALLIISNALPHESNVLVLAGPLSIIHLYGFIYVHYQLQKLIAWGGSNSSKEVLLCFNEPTWGWGFHVPFEATGTPV